MNEAGKGSKQRPTNHEAYSTAWDKIFGRKTECFSDTQSAQNAAAVMPMLSIQTGVTVSPATAQAITDNIVQHLQQRNQ